MAIDTRDKRSSIITLALPFSRVLPNPDNSVDPTDFGHLLLMYSGVLPAGPAYPVMRRWGGVTHVGQGRQFGRTW